MSTVSRIIIKKVYRRTTLSDMTPDAHLVDKFEGGEFSYYRSDVSPSFGQRGRARQVGPKSIAPARGLILIEPRIFHINTVHHSVKSSFSVLIVGEWFKDQGSTDDGYLFCPAIYDWTGTGRLPVEG